MKKIILFTFLITSFSYAQKKDVVNEFMFVQIKKIGIESQQHKELVIDQLKEITEKTKDTVLLAKVQEYKKSIDSIQPIIGLKADYDKLTKKDLKGFRENYDEFKKSRFIYSKIRADLIHPYIALNDGNMYLRLKTKYSGSGWVFADKVKIIIDDEIFTYELGSTDRNVRTGRFVEEKSDILVDEYLLGMLEKISISQEKIKMRFKGDKYYDTKIRKADIRKIKEVLALYNKLKATLN